MNSPPQGEPRLVAECGHNKYHQPNIRFAKESALLARIFPTVYHNDYIFAVVPCYSAGKLYTAVNGAVYIGFKHIYYVSALLSLTRMCWAYEDMGTMVKKDGNVLECMVLGFRDRIIVQEGNAKPLEPMTITRDNMASLTFGSVKHVEFVYRLIQYLWKKPRKEVFHSDTKYVNWRDGLMSVLYENKNRKMSMAFHEFRHESTVLEDVPTIFGEDTADTIAGKLYLSSKDHLYFKGKLSGQTFKVCIGLNDVASIEKKEGGILEVTTNDTNKVHFVLKGTHGTSQAPLLDYFYEEVTWYYNLLMSKTRVYGVPLSKLCGEEPYHLPKVVVALSDYIKKNCLKDEGIFRVAASRADIIKAQNLIDHGHPITDQMLSQDYLAPDLLKKFFRDLPKTVFGSELFVFFASMWEAKVSGVVTDEEVMNGIESKMKLLGRRESLLMAHLAELADLVTQHSDVNKMNLQNVCIVWGPLLFRSDDNIGGDKTDSIKRTVYLTELLQFLVMHRKRLVHAE
ncbi:Rho GTPase activating protein [Planoprotostelium fungivorum]|uniref:Rho GTPase activating protein n=1 Tax=Planoprotostelium fungivorum TaxID=1890364 RepID=A0A2P6NS86_9EUKA|nr:Rho GTPase activating protein [Planoprotostelium fungivorum]